MECYYHPERESTDTCAICGKSICKECGLEIAGKIYCKECLKKIVGLRIDNNAQPEPQTVATAEPERTEPVRLNKPPVEESIYQPQEEIRPTAEIKQINDDSPYNIRDNNTYSRGPESSYISESEVAPQVQETVQPQTAQNEYDLQSQTIAQAQSNSQDFIYPDHSYEPEPTSARVELEDKYEKYLDDLYFDEADVPLGEQLAKDEEEFGSLTRQPYQPRREEQVLNQKPKSQETPEEMEARIRAEILAEKDGKKRGRKNDTNIHNLNYQDEKEPMGVVDIVLTIILVIVILIVIYYLIYIFVLNSTYPTFMDAIYALGNPQNVINNILSPTPAP